MAIFRGLLDPDKFMTQVGQLRTINRNEYGSTVVTSITTTVCLVYQDQEMQTQQAPLQAAMGNHFLVVPNTLTIALDDHITAVVDRDGVAVLADAKIKRVTEQNHWRYGTRFQVCLLDVTNSEV